MWSWSWKLYPEFDLLAVAVFNTRLAQANLVTQREFDTKLKSLNKKQLTQVKQNVFLFKMSWKN